MNSVDKYLDNIFNDEKFIKLKELKELIDSKYKKEILKFKLSEAKYLEAKEYEMYYPNFEEIKNNFIEAKKDLYSKEEVKLYFSLERKIQEMLDNDLNELKESISNKFSLTNRIKI